MDNVRFRSFSCFTDMSSVRDLVRLRLVSAKWARGLRGFRGELRIVGVTRQANKMSAEQMQKVGT